MQLKRLFCEICKEWVKPIIIQSAEDLNDYICPKCKDLLLECY